MNVHGDTELLAPAGSPESLRAAIQAGADAVYFGAGALNMRARSSRKFSLANLEEIAGVCRRSSVKSYVALNTVLYDEDMAAMQAVVDRAAESGVSAIIAADIAAIHYARGKNMPVHISTQANISNMEAVRFYSQFADAVVLARELNLGQIKSITDGIRREEIRGPSGTLLRAEVFVHGAMCMAVSGRCYLSLHTHLASANRGLCLQNCRRPYTIVDENTGLDFRVEEGTVLSAKDLCAVGILPDLLKAGVRMFKIEGRGRAPDYVHTVTKCYREALDALALGAFTPEKVKGWESRLAGVFNRGFWDGYYLGGKVSEWNARTGSAATERKVYIGKGIKYYKKLKVAEFRMETGELSGGESILITGPTTGVIRDVVTGLRTGDGPVHSVTRGNVFTMPVAETVRSSDKLYKIVRDDQT